MNSEKAPYLILLTFSGTPDRTLVADIEASISSPVKPLMFGAGFTVLGATWAGTAHQLWKAVTSAKLTAVKELLIVQAGQDWCAGADKPAQGWLTRNVGDSRAW